MRLVLGLLILLLLPLNVEARQVCYSPAELQAEQLLRLHSELMVITVTCRQGSQGQDLVPAYTNFTRRYLAQLRDAEQTMMHFYKAHYSGDCVKRVDTLRTKLANEIGQQAANLSAPTFCAERRDKVVAFSNDDSLALNNEVKYMCAATKSYVPVCINTASR